MNIVEGKLSQYRSSCYWAGADAEVRKGLKEINYVLRLLVDILGLVQKTLCMRKSVRNFL